MKLGKKIRTTYEMRTNQDGIAKVPSIPKGKILIQVIAKGYQTFGQSLRRERTGEDHRNQAQSAAAAVLVPPGLTQFRAFLISALRFRFRTSRCR